MGSLGAMQCCAPSNSSLTMASVPRPFHQYDGPGQYAIVVADEAQTLLHFHDFHSAQQELPAP